MLLMLLICLWQHKGLSLNEVHLQCSLGLAADAACAHVYYTQAESLLGCGSLVGWRLPASSGVCTSGTYTVQ